MGKMSKRKRKASKAKKKFKEAISAKYGGAVQAIKTVGRSLYGYLKYVWARWGNPWAARAVTAEGRNRVRNAAGFVKIRYQELENIYGDTDSIFVQMPEEYFNKEFCEKFSEEASDALGTQLALDKMYKRIFFCETAGGTRMAKKKYIYLDMKDEIGMAGFAAIRGDWSRVSTRTQVKVAELVLKAKNVKFGVKRAIRYVNFVLEHIKLFPLKDFIISVGIRDLDTYEDDHLSPHVVIARRNPDLIDEDGKVEYVICREAGYEVWGDEYRDIISYKALHPSELKNKSDLDWTFYRYNQVANLADRIIGMFLKNFDIAEEIEWDIPESDHYAL